jgi:adenylate cyclase class 2
MTSDRLEREIKLSFDNPAAARAAVLAAGATPLRAPRLQQDCLLDTAEQSLFKARSLLRVRSEDGRALLTFKGPVQPSAMKLREEIEANADDPAVVLSILERIGFRVWFRYEKRREEFAFDEVIIAVDETPIGTYVEIEGSEAGVRAAALALARGPADYVTESYRGLYVSYCEAHGWPVGDMLFDRG